MAERRMFAKTIIDSDTFIDMPLSAQMLYFHLAMRADDDGFVNNPKKIQRMIGAGDDDAKLLVAKRFVLAFDSGVIVIKHWRMHNYLRSDRYKETVYSEEKAQLEVKKNGSYSLINNIGIPDSNQCETQVRLGKDRIGKESIEIGESESMSVSEKKLYMDHVYLFESKYTHLCEKYGERNVLAKIAALNNYIAQRHATYAHVKDHAAQIETWIVNDVAAGKIAIPHKKKSDAPPPIPEEERLTPEQMNAMITELKKAVKI
jgi:hypothetical protein